jgi:hypothetical protein
MDKTELFKLTDKQVIPTDEYLLKIIGDKLELLKMVINYASGKYSDVSGEWRYYNDGKQWLYKLTRKKNTIFWGSVLGDAFRVTFYFGTKYQPLIDSSDLPESIKDDFNSVKNYGKIKPITIFVTEKSQLENIYKLIDLKQKTK